MGVSIKSRLSSKSLSKGFLMSQSHWGHTKQILNHSMSAYIIGTKDGFVIFNSGHFVEYSRRCSIFCSNVILNKGSALFINFGTEYKKLTVFFGSRSLQPIYAHEWVGGSITNNFVKKPSIIITHNIPKDSFILKEASRRFVPIITIEDSDYSLNKSFYSSLGNDNNKDSICYFYSILTESIIKAQLLAYANNSILKY